MKYLILVLALLSNVVLAITPTKGDVYFASGGDGHNEPEAIKTTSGLCHDASSPYLARIKVYASGASRNVHTDMISCLKSGGRIPSYIRQRSSDDELAAYDAIVSKNAEKIKEAKDEQKAEEESIKKFGGLSWAPGLLFVHYENAIVESAFVDDGKVSVDHEINTYALAVLESHYFWTIGNKFGHGPFVSIGIAGEEGVDPLSTFGAGWMIGLRSSNTKVNSWNIGVGYFTDTSADTLKPGLEDGKPTDIIDSAKLTRKEQVEGWGLMFSASF